MVKKVSHTFISGKFSTVLVLPVAIARKHGLDKPSDVIVEETDNGILVRKLEIESQNVNQKKEAVCETAADDMSSLPTKFLTQEGSPILGDEHNHK
jgi:bifunctional DNA-binding transcriptional regulator/antitoxin component of YhaV-PrlF toxin-antitoxin module